MEASHSQRLARLPHALSRWLGYRSGPPKPLPCYAVPLWSFIATFCGVSVIQAAFQAPYFVQRDVPSVIASFGATAVLIYGSIDSPLAQPRSLLGGHLLGALFGTAVSKLFHHLPPSQYAHLQWLAGSLAVALSLVAMQLTRTVHPPAGATALLAAVNAEVIALGWYLIPVVLLSSVLALGVALVVNNVQRRYPVFWVTPNEGGSTGTSSIASESSGSLDGHADGKSDEESRKDEP